MRLAAMLESRHMTKAQLSKKSGVPWATVSDLCSEKADIRRAEAMTVYKLANVLDTSVECLLDIAEPDEKIVRPSFDNFKSEMCHRLKRMGDIDFLIDIIESGEIRSLYEKELFPEALYLLAMTDYVSRRNQIPICSDYDDLRENRLSKPLYPASAWIPYYATGDTSKLRYCRKHAIAEFSRFNIMEGEIDNVV